MIITTTTSVEGRPVQQYLGIVAGEAIMGANIVRDLFASITDIIGGRSGAYEAKLQQARETALAEMSESAPTPWLASTSTTRSWVQEIACSW